MRARATDVFNEHQVALVIRNNAFVASFADDAVELANLRRPVRRDLDNTTVSAGFHREQERACEGIPSGAVH
jgi:hypothetical protein